MKQKLIFTLLLFGFFVNVRKHKINPRLRTTNTNYLCTTNRNYLCTSNTQVQTVVRTLALT